MHPLELVFSPEAESQLIALERYIAANASPSAAEAFVEAVITRCEALAFMPRQGTPRGDLRPGLRTIAYRRRVVIAYAVSAKLVTILGVFYGGQDFEALLQSDDAEDDVP